MLTITEDRFLEASRISLGVSIKLAREFCDENAIDTHRLPWIENNQEVHKLEKVSDKVPCSIFEFTEGFGLIYSITAFEPFGLVFHESDAGYKRLKTQIENGRIKTAEIGCLAFVYLGNEELSWLEEDLTPGAYLHQDVIRTLRTNDIPALWPMLTRHCITENGTLVSYPAVAATVAEAIQLLWPFDKSLKASLSTVSKQVKVFTYESENRIEATRELIACLLSEALYQFRDTYGGDPFLPSEYCSNKANGSLKDPSARKARVMDQIQTDKDEEVLSLVDFFWLTQFIADSNEATALTTLSDYRYQGFFGLNMFLEHCTDGQFSHLPRTINFWFSIESGKHYPSTMLSPDETRTVRLERLTLTSLKRVVAERATAQVYKNPDFTIKDVLTDCSAHQAMAYLQDLQETCGDDSLALPEVNVFSQDLVNLFVGAETLYISELKCLKNISIS